MWDSPGPRSARSGLPRRDFLRLGAVATAAALVPATASAAPPPDKKPGGPTPPTPAVDPYTGSIPLTFPLKEGDVQPVLDNWHHPRDGNYGYDWSHQNSPARRAHDGIDLFPLSADLPLAYAPFAARVVDVNVDGYRRATDATLRPPWDYGRGNIYGNYLWLCCTEGDGRGFFAFYCHLHDEAVLRGLADTLATAGAPAVTANDVVGQMGETGNATGDPQLHLELHYPLGQSFTCTRCTRKKSGMTALNPYPSLSKAAPRR